MDSKIPFTSYDFWAYLSAGFLLLFVADHIAGTEVFARASWTLVQGIVVVSGAYALGQIAASAAALLLERGLVERLLGAPRNVLFGRPRAWRWVRRLLPGYFRGLPDEVRAAALDRGRMLGIDGPGQALFWAAFQHARETPVVMARLDNFLNLYGFCRNTALVALVDGALLYGAYRWGEQPAAALYWSWAAWALAAGMTLRYLKFYRLYAVEVFTAFAYAPPPNSASTNNR